MRFRAYALIVVIACAVAALAQENPPHYMDRAEILRHQSSATVQADSARPLLQAVTAVREEYGWVVDYEDPPYSGTFDLTPDASISRQGKRVFMVPSGGAFSSTYAEAPDMWSSTGEQFQVLEKILSDYNATRNPGKFVLREQVDGSYAVVGDAIENSAGGQIPVRPILDTPISLPRTTRSAAATVDLIQDALTKASGIVVGAGIGPLNVLSQSQVTVGGNNVPARDLLLEAIDQIKSVKLVWELLGDSRSFYLNLLPAERAHYDVFGRRRMTIIR